MVARCEHFHIKRFLMVGGDEIHPRIRQLMEGQTVEFRLIQSSDQSSVPRIQSRLESCDLLITWRYCDENTQAGHSYRKVAPLINCPMVELSGSQADVHLLTRQVTLYLSRTGGH